MPVLDDLRVAVDNYATNNCKTEIVNFSIISGGNVLNVNETFQFKVKVTNENHLDMTGVKVQALGTGFADVSLPLGPFGSSATSATFNLAAGQSHTTGFFNGKAKAKTIGVQSIVKARISQWDASLEHILKDHSATGAAEALLNVTVSPD